MLLCNNDNIIALSQEMTDREGGEYFRGRDYTHCACGSLSNACSNWVGPAWQNPWTGKGLREGSSTWKRITRHCRHLDGREDESSGPPSPRRPRRVLVEAAVVGPASEADELGEDGLRPQGDLRPQGASIDVPSIKYSSHKMRYGRLPARKNTKISAAKPSKKPLIRKGTRPLGEKVIGKTYAPKRKRMSVSKTKNVKK